MYFIIVPTSPQTVSQNNLGSICLCDPKCYNKFMNIFKKYIAYIKDNPEGYWFKRKVYGWGWTPATWQGWLVTVIFVLLVILFALTLDENSSGREVAFTFFLPVVLLLITFVRIAHRKGEKPRWQWGFPKKDE